LWPGSQAQIRLYEGLTAWPHSAHVRLETPPERPGPAVSPPDPETPRTADRTAAAAALSAARAAMAARDVTTAIDILETFNRTARDAEVSFTLGVWTLSAENPEQALDHFQNAAHLAPGVAEVFINIAAAAVRLGRHDEAVEAAQKAISLAPDRDVAHGALGNALAAVGRLEAAEAAFLEAHARAPATLSWMLNLGDCLLTKGDPDAARGWFNQASAGDPTSAIALNGLGLCLQAQADHAAAIPFFEKALTQQDQYPEALGNLGVSLQCLGRHEDALVVARRSVELAPGDSGAALNLGHILQSLGRHTEAVETYEDALRIDPALSGTRAYLLHSRRHICAWDRDADLVAAVIDDVRSGGQVPPFALAGTTADPETRLIAARRSADVHRPGSVVTTPRATPNKQTLRVGFVSPDFRTHSLGMSFSSVLAARDDPRIAWIGYSIAAGVTDQQTTDFAASFDDLADLDGLSAEQAAARIRSDDIDVLVDLAGHTLGSRLDIFAQRPAPVQAHYLGYGSTVGADYIPWLITDRVHTPPSLAEYCSEAFAYLPNTFMAAGRVSVPQEIPTRTQEGLPEDGVVFASFNATYKLDPAAFAVWMDILTGVPNSVLWLRAANDAVQNRLRAAATHLGIDGKRIIFAARKDRADHLARHQLADICLDAFGHTGGVTTLDALLAGVPVLTVAGESQSARTGASILSALGTPEWILPDVAGYTATAIALGTDVDRLQDAKRVVRDQVAIAPLFDPALLARHLNAAFRAMYEMAAEGRAPTTFDVRSEPT
jgi:protein O-GlcNAc transferase